MYQIQYTTYMKKNTIYEIIQCSLDILEKEVNLSNSSLKVAASRSFKPISDFFSKSTKYIIMKV